VLQHSFSEARTFPDRGPGPAAASAPVDSYRRLAEIFHLVLAEQDLDSLLRRLADSLAELIPYDALHVYEADEAERRLRPVLARGEWEDEILQMSPAYGEGITGWAVLHREPVLTNKAHLDGRVAFVPGTPPDPEALISVPLIARGALKGALNVYRLGDLARFSDDEFELARRFADAAALALDNAQIKARLELQAQTDSLTGLYNHRHFHERLRAELSRAGRTGKPVAVLMFDIDDFKKVNDVYGHGTGDQVLVAVADAARSVARASDVVCRIGGEEFAMIMPSCSSGDARGIGRRLLARLSERSLDEAGEVTLSIGVAQGPEHATSSRELVGCAEVAMMTAKAGGKNRVVVFDGGEAALRPDAPDGDRALRSIAHLKLLQSLAGKLNRLRDVQEIGEAIVTELGGLVDYHACRVFVVEGSEAIALASRGHGKFADGTPIDLPRIRLGRGIVGHVAATGRPLLLGNARESAHAIQIPGTDAVDESAVAVPLRYGSRVVGVVFLSKLGLDQFDEDDLRLLEVLAGQAAVALENARLYEAVRFEAENAKAWLEFADAISAADGFDAICAETVGRVVATLGIDQSSLWLQHPVTDDFYCAASQGYDSDAGTEAITRAHIPRELGDRLLAERKTPFALTSAEVRKTFWGNRRGLKVRAIACAPLPVGHGVRGWLSVRQADDDVSQFTETRLRLLDGFAYRISMALQKERLYRSARESAEIAESLLESVRELASAGSVEERLERIVERASSMLGAPKTSVWFQDEPDGPLRLWSCHGYSAEEQDWLRTRPYTGAMAQAVLASSEPYVLTPEVLETLEIPTTTQGRRFAIAPMPRDASRNGMIAAVAPVAGEFEFTEVRLRLLASLADQARLALFAAGA